MWLLKTVPPEFTEITSTGTLARNLNLFAPYCYYFVSIFEMCISFPFLFFFFLGLHLWHMEVPRLACSCRPTWQPKQCEIWAASVTYITAHGNARALIHWARPGSKLTSSWILLGLVTHWTIMGTPWDSHFFREKYSDKGKKWITRRSKQRFSDCFPNILTNDGLCVSFLT